MVSEETGTIPAEVSVETEMIPGEAETDAIATAVAVATIFEEVAAGVTEVVTLGMAVSEGTETAGTVTAAEVSTAQETEAVSAVVVEVAATSEAVAVEETAEAVAAISEGAGAEEIPALGSKTARSSFNGADFFWIEGFN